MRGAVLFKANQMMTNADSWAVQSCTLHQVN